MYSGAGTTQEHSLLCQSGRLRLSGGARGQHSPQDSRAAALLQHPLPTGHAAPTCTRRSGGGHTQRQVTLLNTSAQSNQAYKHTEFRKLDDKQIRRSENNGI